ncbi:alpha/beta hydrolase family esterase [Stenomitos frigidus]|nr:PHB depolymerase family esterase [Stenomitos frigidus]
MNRVVGWWRVVRLVPLPMAIAIGLTACRLPSGKREASPHSDAASAAQPLQLGDATGELVYEGQRRTYHLYTPKTYQPDRPVPLVLAFHGYGSQGKDLANGSGFNQTAEQKGFVVVYPDGIDRRWNPLNKLLTGVDDVGFVPALIAHIKQVRAIDPRRVYAAGVSNGGFLVQRLACKSSSQIAAFASVVATLPSQLQGSCNPQTPVPILMINGTDDRKVPWQGGNLGYGSILSVPGTIDFWQRRNNCPPSPHVKQLTGDRVEIARYPNCQGGSEVELVTLKGVGHVWPRGGSGSASLLNGSEEIWSFFQRHRLGQG